MTGYAAGRSPHGPGRPRPARAGARSTLPRRVLLLLTLVGLASIGPVHAQTSVGSTGATAGGLALGAYSGAVLGLVGSALPCNRTLMGSRCAAAGSGTGAAIGLAMGGVIGARSEFGIDQRLESAGVGSLVGAGIGVILWRAVRQYEWKDAVTVAAVGGAFGAAPAGSAWGGAAGAVAGGVVWLAFPRAGLGDFLMFTVAGAAVGGLVDWTRGAARAGGRTTPVFSPTFSISVR